MDAERADSRQTQTDFARAAAQLVAVFVRGRMHAHVLRAVETQLDVVLFHHRERVVDHYPAGLFVERDSPPMQYRVAEAQIAVLPTLEDVPKQRGIPEAAPRVGLAQPHEAPGLLRL